MEFREYAANETSTLVTRLLAGSGDASREQLQRFRAALDGALSALEASLGASPEIAHEVRDLAGRLTAAAAAGAEKAAKRAEEEARSAADALRAELTEQMDALGASLREARAQADALRADLATEKQHSETTFRELVDAHDLYERAEAGRREAEAARDDEAQGRHSAERELRELQATLDSIEAARMEAEAARAEEARSRAAAESEIHRLQEELEGLRAEIADATREMEIAADERGKLEDSVTVAQSQAQAAEAQLGAVTDLFKTSAARVKALERTQKEHNRTVRNLEAKLRVAGTSADAGRASVSLLDDLLGGFEALAGATTISDVLSTLMEHLAGDFSRVALFRPKGNRLEGEHQIGFDTGIDIKKVIIPLDADSLLSRAANSGRVERLTGSDLANSSRAPFGGTPTRALALPIAIQEDTLAIVYADDSGQARTETTPAAADLSMRFAEALRQHAGALLMRLTTELKTLAELRTYAGSLLNEIEQMYASDVTAGTTGEDLRHRLRANVEYARSIYANRVAFEGADAAALLDDQLATMIEAQSATQFGQDLAMVVGGTDLSSSTTNATAEASG
jgi:hypothetical protein